MPDSRVTDPDLLCRLAAAFRGVPRVAHAGAHIYPAAAPAFVRAPRAERPHPDHPCLRIYAHVPFCRSKCSYCCYSVTVSKDPADMVRYVDALRRELTWIEPGTPLRQLFVGGGTPTCLPADLLALTLDAIFERTTPYGQEMHVVEASPETVTAEHARVLREHGVGRVSMGVQSLDAAVIETTGRAHGSRKALDAVRLLVDSGFVLNIDLMYGLPGQTEASFREDFRRLAAAGVHSITTYDLRVTRAMPVARRLQRDEWLSLGRLMRWRAFVKTTAEEAGFTQTRWHTYQRLDGRAPQHRRAPSHTTASHGFQLGIGLSARSHLGAAVYRNHKSFDAYCRRVEAGQSPVEDVFELTTEDRRVQHVARSLGDGHPLDAAAYQGAFGSKLEDDYGVILARLTEAGALTRTPGGYELSEAGKLLYDLVTLAFYPPRMQQWLQAHQPVELVAEPIAL